MCCHGNVSHSYLTLKALAVPALQQHTRLRAVLSVNIWKEFSQQARGHILFTLHHCIHAAEVGLMREESATVSDVREGIITADC